MAVKAVGRALGVLPNPCSEYHIADTLPCLHSSDASSSSLRHQFPALCCVPTRLCPSTCSPTRTLGKVRATRKSSDEKVRRVIQSPRNPPKALSGSSEEAARVQKYALEHKARFVAHSRESCVIEELERPLVEYMRLPASQYSVLDAERIERVDENTFRCYVYRFKFFSFEVCPVLLVKVEQQPYGCCIRLLSCKLEGSPIVVAQNEKFAASMENEISCNRIKESSSTQRLISDTTIEVVVEIPFAFRAIPVALIESTGNQVLEQLLRMMVPRFLSQLAKDYKAWASGDESRQPLGTGQI